MMLFKFLRHTVSLSVSVMQVTSISTSLTLCLFFILALSFMLSLVYAQAHKHLHTHKHTTYIYIQCKNNGSWACRWWILCEVYCLMWGHWGPVLHTLIKLCEVCQDTGHKGSWLNSTDGGSVFGITALSVCACTWQTHDHAEGCSLTGNLAFMFYSYTS